MESCFYTICNPIVVGCKLFQNNLATIPVIDGYYSNGNNCFHVTGGTVQEITVCPSGSNVFCYTIVDEDLTQQTITCLSNQFNIQPSRTTITLYDSSGNTVTATEDLTFTVIYDAQDCQSVQSELPITITVLSGQSSAIYNYIRLNWVDCGQGQCLTEFQTYNRVDSVPPQIPLVVECSSGVDCIDYTVSSSAASPQPVNYINCSGQANVDYVGGAGGVDIIHVCAQEGTVSVGPGFSVSSNGECVAIGECKILNVTISQLDVDASDNSTVTMTYTDCYGGQSTYPFNDGGTFNIELCVSNGSSFAFSYLQGGATMNSGASGAIIQGPCTPTPTFRAWHFSSPGRPSASNACANHTFSNTFYSQYVGGTIPAMGSTMYLDQGLTTPVGGGDQWYNLQEAYMDDLETAYQINSAGQLVDFFYCNGAPVGTTYAYRRDGSQIEGNPSFHIPYVTYVDTNNTTQTIYLSMDSDDCQDFVALSITDSRYALQC